LADANELVRTEKTKDELKERRQKSWSPIISKENGGMNIQTLKRKFTKVLDGKAINSGISIKFML
jgi:hypothetical protein